MGIHFPLMGNEFPLMGIHSYFPLMGIEFPLMGNHFPLMGNKIDFPLMRNHIPVHPLPTLLLERVRIFWSLPIWGTFFNIYNYVDILHFCLQNCKLTLILS